MMQACVISTAHPAFDTRVFHREARSLADAGFQVQLIIQHDVENDVVNNVHIIGLPRARSRWQRLLSGGRAFRLALAQHADIYHFHDPELIPWAIALRLFSHRPVVYDVHEHYPDAILAKQWLPRFLRRPVAALFDLSERLSSRLFDAVVVADETIAERFRGSHHRVVVLYNFPGRDTFSDAATGTADSAREHAIQLVYVGVVGSTRGLWIMLDAVHILATEYDLDVGLSLAGPFGYAHEERSFKERLEGDGRLEGRVTWLGAVPHNDVPALLARADVGLVPLQPLPKYLKNIPTKQFEYMAAGLPLVGSDLPPIRRFVEAAQAGRLALADDPHAHAAEIAYLVQHPDQARQMGKNGRRAFETEYNWDTQALKLLDLYHELTKQRSEGGTE